MNNANISIVRTEGTLNDRILNSDLNNIGRIKFSQNNSKLPQDIIDRINKAYEFSKETESDAANAND